MDGDLIRAVKLLENECSADPDGVPPQALLGALFSALTAYVAEIRKRRAGSPWFQPTEALEMMQPETCPGGIKNGMTVVNALCAWFGYDADGRDMLEGL